MKSQITKHDLNDDVSEETRIETPLSSQFLTVREDAQGRLSLWVLVLDVSEKNALHLVTYVATGETLEEFFDEIPPLGTQYIGSLIHKGEERHYLRWVWIENA